MSIPIAIAVADLHFCHKPPVARLGETNWYGAMERQLKWLKEQQRTCDVPILCAGDIFHRWNPPPELINFVLQELPTMYAVPGQHDLPYHSYDEIKKSAYWTLVKAGKIMNLLPTDTYQVVSNGIALRLRGFPFGFPLESSKRYDLPGMDIAVIHDYCWESGFSFPGAPEMKNANEHSKVGSGYDVLVFGDNHKGFLKTDIRKMSILNCGTFFRRNVDEIDYQPYIGLIYSDGSVKRVPIPVDQDIITSSVENGVFAGFNTEMGEFVKYLSGVLVNSLDIEKVISEYIQIHGTPVDVIQEITKLLEMSRHE